MKISVNCKLDSQGALGFIKPLADIEDIEQIQVFRDTEAASGHKVTYYTPKIRKPAFLCQFFKFFQMLRYIPADTSLAIGIYEFPHGLLAVLIGKLRRIPAAVCIIGNPGYKKIRKGLRKFLMYSTLKRATAVTVTGTKAKQVLIDNAVSEDKIYILPNSFDCDIFSPRTVPKKYDMLSLSYLGEEKRLDNFLRIVDLLRKTRPTIKAAIAGKGPQKEKLELMAKQMSLDKNVEFLGYVEDSAGCFNRSQLFVLTSMTEGLPRTLIEAMACGVPVIASNVGDIPDLIKNDFNGFTVDDYNNIEEFAEKILLLLSDKNKYDTFVKNAAEYVKENYSQAAASEVWKKIFKVICKQ